MLTNFSSSCASFDIVVCTDRNHVNHRSETLTQEFSITMDLNMWVSVILSRSYCRAYLLPVSRAMLSRWSRETRWLISHQLVFVDLQGPCDAARSDGCQLAQ